MQTRVLINGDMYALESKDTPDLIVKMREVEATGATIERYQPPKEAPSRLMSTLGGMGMGGTLGFADEISAAVQAPFSNLTYDQIRDYNREQYAGMRDAHPGYFAGGEVVGAIGGPGGVAGLAGRGARGAAAGTNLLKLTGAGAFEGSMAGAGYSDDPTLAGMAEDAATGAVVGAIAAPVASYALPMAWNTGKRVKDALFTGAKSRHRQMLGENVRNLGGTDYVMDQLDNLGVEGRLMDVSDSMLGMTSAAGAKSNEAVDIISDVIGTRQSTSKGRLIGALEDATDARYGSGRKMKTDLTALRAADAAAEYQFVETALVDNTDEIRKILNTPLMKSYVKQMTKKWQSLNLTDTDPFAGDKIPLQLIQDLKVQVDRGARALGMPGQPAATVGNAKALADMNEMLLKQVDDQFPEYAIARESYAKKSAMLDRLKEGEEFAKNTKPDDVHALTLDDSPDSNLIRSGSVQRLGDTIVDDKAPAGNYGRRLISSLSEEGSDESMVGMAEHRLRELSQSPQQASDLFRTVDAERTFNDNYLFLKGTKNSKTAGKAEAVDRMSGDTGVLSSLLGALRGQSNPTRLLDNAVSGNFTEETAKELAKTLTKRGITRAEIDVLVNARQIPPEYAQSIYRWLEAGGNKLGRGATVTAAPMLIGE